MNAGELQRYKTLLLVKREELLAEFDTKDLAPRCKGRRRRHHGSGASGRGGVQISLRQVDNQTLREVEAALMRINQRTFGMCEMCQQPLSEARQEAVPWSPICRKCKEDMA